MNAPTFSGTVSANCVFVPDVPARWSAWLSHLRGKRVTVTLEKERSTRSTQQNRYWWSCIVPMFQEIWSLARTEAGLPPYSREQVHEVLVEALAGCEDGPLPGTRVRKRTSQMDSADFTKLVDAARALAWDNYGVSIPSPGEGE